MTHVARMITVYLLALTLAVLPFSTSFGFFMTGSDFSMTAGHADSVACSENADHAACPQMSDQQHDAAADDVCCSDHCDSFSGAQICTDIAQETDIPFTDEYTAAVSPRVSDLIPTRLLRPPLLVS